MFKKLFKKNTKSTEIIKEVVMPCSCNRNNEHCDLVLKLRECQDLKNKIKNEITTLSENSRELISKFIYFLKALEESGLRMGSYDKWMFNEHSIRIVEYTLHEYSSADIFRITEELRTYKSKEDIISEKRRALKAVEDDIKNIKSKLGIE